MICLYSKCIPNKIILKSIYFLFNEMHNLVITRYDYRQIIYLLPTVKLLSGIYIFEINVSLPGVEPQMYNTKIYNFKYNSTFIYIF